MKKESYDRLLAAYDEAFQAMGITGFNIGINYLCEEMAKTLKLLKNGRTRVGLEALMTKEPEPTPQQLDWMVKIIELFPYQLRKALPEAAKDAAKHIRHEPGGRPQALKDENHVGVCDEIARLYGRGVSLKDAQQRIAQKWDVSLRTIQRIWQKRNKSGGLSEDKSGRNA